MTKGSPMRLILGFGIPVLFGYLFQQLYNVVDTAIVGKTLGGAALAAVGSTGSISFLVVGFCTGICGGFAIPVAQQFGAGNNQELRRYVTGGVWLSIAIGTVLGGSLVTEVVFNYPGLGNILYQAILARDYPVIQGQLLIMTIAMLVANFIVDISYVLLDPCLRRT